MEKSAECIPFLLLTAKESLDDKQHGFSLGTDDYMTKPFSTDELLWRVSALLRRANIMQSKKIQIGTVTVDSEKYAVYNNQEYIEFPKKEFDLLFKLLSYPDRIFSIVRKLCELIKEEKDFDTVMNEVNKYMNHTHVTFALSSFDNLVKNGRMNKISGFIANKLGLLGVGIASERGTIEVKGVSRGRRKAIEAILNDMKLRGTYIKEVVISHCQNIEFAEQVKTAILNIWNDASVTIMPTRGLCSYYAERGGLIIGF